MHYVRPTWSEPTYRAADGSSFRFGNRWPVDGPPENSYSVNNHPERFAPLHEVADALVIALVAEYDATATRTTGAPNGWPPAGPAVIRSVTLTPATEAAAPLTVRWTDHPGLWIQTGALATFPIPDCGCDACDETASAAADRLERLVFAVVSGNLDEQIGGRRGWITMPVRYADGSEITRTRVRYRARAEISAARARLARRPADRWQPWPLRPLSTAPAGPAGTPAPAR